MCAGTHFVAAALARVLIEGVMRAAGLRLSFTHTLTRVLVQVMFRPAARHPQVLPTHTPTRLLIQLFVGAAEVLLEQVFWGKRGTWWRLGSFYDDVIILDSFTFNSFFYV